MLRLNGVFEIFYLVATLLYASAVVFVPQYLFALALRLCHCLLFDCSNIGGLDHSVNRGSSRNFAWRVCLTEKRLSLFHAH